MFEKVVYDLDSGRITDFRLKPWAGQFIVLRAKLYSEDDGHGTAGNNMEGNSGKNEAVFLTNSEYTALKVAPVVAAA